MSRVTSRIATTPPAPPPDRRRSLRLLRGSSLCLGAVVGTSAPAATVDELAAGFREPPMEARPHTYWLWMNGHLHAPSAVEELRAMKEAGLSGVLLFEMGPRGDKAAFRPPAPNSSASSGSTNSRLPSTRPAPSASRSTCPSSAVGTWAARGSSPSTR
jgi:hypothetical protein